MLPRTIVCNHEEVAVKDPWQAQREALGAFIRSQRRMANLSLRQLAELTHLSKRKPPRVLSLGEIEQMLALHRLYLDTEYREGH